MTIDVWERAVMDTNAIKIRKIIKFIDAAIDKGLTVLFLMVLFIGVYFTYDSWYVFNSSSLNQVPGYVWKGAETLAELPKDAKAWLTIDDTKINCPIMQGETNEDYLNKNPYGEYALAGSVFLDSSNDSAFNDKYSLLYGHNMADEYMFGAIKDYLDVEFFDNHRIGTLTVRDGEGTSLGENSKAKTVEQQIREDKSYHTVYEINIFAVVETDAKQKVVFDVQSEEDLMKYIKDNASIYREPVGDKVLGLSTCTNPLDTGRIVVFATLDIKGNEYIPTSYKTTCEM